MIAIPPDIALRIARRRCADAGCELILPDDPRRTAVVMGVAAAHALQGTGVTSDHVAEYTTVTLPGLPGLAADALGMIPVVGRFLAALAQRNGRSAIYLSPYAIEHSLLPTVAHELGHVGAIAHGGIPWCGVYLLSGEARAGGEAPCFGAGMAVAVAMGKPLADAVADAKRSLGSYALDADAKALAEGIIDSAAATIAATGDYGGVVAELRAECAREGVVLT